MFLAKPRRRKERQDKAPLCAFAAWRETLFRFSVVSVDGVSQEESASAQEACAVPLRAAPEERACFTVNVSAMIMVMAILTARSVRNVLQEASGFLSEEQTQRLVDRLNAGGDDALAAEWELIVLAALSYVGVVQHEPEFGGARKLDFRFDQPATGLKIVGDVTALSDDEILVNSVNYLSTELSRRLDMLGIRGQTAISVAVGEVGPGGSVQPRLPHPHEFRRYVFNKEFVTFAKGIITNPGGAHVLEINNEKAELSVQFSPGAWTTMISYRDFRMPRDIVNNIIHHALRRKHDQIKGAGHSEGDGLRCVVLCDGNCAALTGRKSWENHSSAEVINQYLRKHPSLDLVARISVQERSHTAGQLEFAVDVFDGPESRVADSVRELFKAGLDRVPRPVRTPVNAKYYIEQRSHGNVFLEGRGGTSYGGHEFTLSSRTLLDYVAGKIDRTTFEQLVNSHPLEILRRRLDEGSLPTEVKLIKSEEKDDDAILIRLGRPDAAASPFVLPRAETP